MRERRDWRRTGFALMLGFLMATGTFAKPRVVVLGFDGADANLTRRLIDEGKLPQLKKLEQDGAFVPLATTNPPQTPVSWSTFATGLNPGRTTIFDFLKREPRTYIPTLALVEEGSRRFLVGEKNRFLGGAIGFLVALTVLALPLALKRRRKLALGLGLGSGVILAGAGYLAFDRYLPRTVPTATNNRQGSTMWDLAAAAGLRTQIIRVPATFPATEVANGQFLSGLGVPDIRGTVGTFSFYTTERLARSEDSEFGGKIVELDPFADHTSTLVYGPRNKLFYQPDAKTHLDPEGDPRDINLPLLLTRTGPRQLTLKTGDTKVSLDVGQWSDWIDFDFPFNPIISLKGMGRFHLISLEPYLRLYLSPINLHPKSPPLPISSPPGYAWDLVQRFGTYKTLGWAEDTWSYTEKRIDEEVFLADVEATVAQEEAMMRGLLKGDDDLYVQVFTFTDRIAHVFWRLTDPLHPAYDAALAVRYGDTIEKWYQRMDTIVGEARSVLGDDPETVLLVVSDHGFATWRRSVNLNTWLVRNGFMTLHTRLGGRELTLEDLFGNKKFWPYVDWSRTKAYALGLGNLYINQRGREPQGIVAPGEEYESTIAALQQGLEDLVDEHNGERPIRKVYRREEMYTGFDPELIPDLRVANNPGYRVSWQSSLGATPEQVFEDNNKPWSADHCSLDPAAVPGILFSSRRLSRVDAAMADVMPTVLGALGVEPPKDLDGSPFL